MKFFNKMEQKLGRFAIPNLMLVLVALQVVGFFLTSINPAIMGYLTFNPAMMAQGQIWRIITFLMVPSSENIFMMLVMSLIYVSIASTLEQVVGRFRVNFFLISGIILLIIAGFLHFFLFHDLFVIMLTPSYLYAMLFVLFALMYPEAQFYLMFVIPIKGKYMVLITVAMYALDIFEGFRSGFTGMGWILVFMIGAAVLAVVLFVFVTKNSVKVSPKQIKRKVEYRQKMTAGTNGPRHKCAVCGRTDITNPDLEFRYCSKCNGNFEYCMDHLYTHVHVTDKQQNQ